MKQLKISIMLILIFAIKMQAQNPTSQSDCKQIEYIMEPPDYSTSNPTHTAIPITPFDPTIKPPGDPKIVYFVHGLGGTDESWAGAAEATSNLPDVEVFRTEYGQNITSNFYTATDDLKNETNDILGYEHIPAEDRYIIAHSQGGLVSRSLDYEYSQNGEENRTFEGIVTFGTPHAGADIADNIDMVIEESKNTIYVLAAPIIKEHILTIFEKVEDDVTEDPNDDDFNFVKFVGEITSLDDKLFDLAGDATALVADMVASHVIPILLGDFLAGTVKEIGTKDMANHEWNEYESQYPIQVMYGAEDNPQFFRYLSTLLDEKEGKFTAPFSMTNDQWMVDSMDVWTTNRYNKYIEWSEIAGAGPSDWEFFLYTIGIEGPVNDFLNAKQTSELYRESYVYLKGLNNLWMTFIGAATSQVEEEFYCSCEVINDMETDFQTFGPFSSPQDCNIGGMTCESFSTFNPTFSIQPNDAVVTVSSQMACPGSQNPVELPGANHSEQRNSPMTGDALTKLYGGFLHPAFQL